MADADNNFTFNDEDFSGWGFEVLENSASSYSLPVEFGIESVYPNPFNPSTELTYTLPSSGEVTLTIYDLQGREVETLLTGHQTAGSHSITWNASGLGSGIYFARLTSENGTTMTRKLLYLK